MKNKNISAEDISAFNGKKINVALIGVGSFTKALVEGVAFYTKHPEERIGLMNPKIGPYEVRHINFVAAFDVDERKVGKKLHDAISAGPNITKQIARPLIYDALVYRGPTLDSVHDAMRKSFVHESSMAAVDIAQTLKASQATMVLNFLPSGGEQATYAYAEAALKAGCSFINCIPTSLAALPEWTERFTKKGLVLLGDDIKSQLGATMLNRILLEFLKMRGIRVVKSEQENKGGNADHFNLLYRAKAKEKSKREALTHFLEKGDARPTVKFLYTGTPSGHKKVTITVEGEMFGRVPLSIVSVIEDEISINGAGVVVDAIRIAQLLLDMEKQKDAWKSCPFLMKSPLHPLSDAEAFKAFNELVRALR